MRNVLTIQRATLCGLFSAAALLAGCGGGGDDPAAPPVVPPAVVVPNAYVLSGTTLMGFRATAPSTILSTVALTGVAAGETLVGIDFRPQNGRLYALGVNAIADTATLYAVSLSTGTAAPVGTTGSIALVVGGGIPVDLPDPAITGYGVDFNPVADRLRVVAGSLSFRVDPNTGSAVDGDGGSVGINPDGAINGGTTTVDASAYTNNQPNNGGITTLYTVDAVSNSLYIQNPPNNGTQTLVATVTLGGSVLDFTSVNAFDIPSGVNAVASNAPVVSGLGLAVLNVGGTTSLYAINLVNGQATLLGLVGNGATAIQGLALRNDLVGLPAVALDNAGNNLLRFITNTPGTVTTQAINTAALVAGERLVGIDWRPATGQLYGLGVDHNSDTATLYLIDPQNGALSVAVGGTGGAIAFAGTALPDPAVAGYGFDFNPTVDRLRVTTSTGLNFRVNPVTGVGVDGDAITAGVNPDGAINGFGSTGVGGTAYTNSFGGAAATTQYTLDSSNRTLFIQNPPNNGTQTAAQLVTLSGVPLSFSAIVGFDIPASVSVATSNTPVTAGAGFAVMTVGGVTSLYRIDLVTGAVTNLGTVGVGGTALSGLALADGP